jgi:hypothetical protein
MVNFVRFYACLASTEITQKASLWISSLPKSPLLEATLETRAEYRQKDFKRFQSFGGEAYDLILSLDILNRSLLALSGYAAICLIESIRLTEAPTEKSLVFTHARAVLSLSSYLQEMTSAAWKLIFSENDLALRLVCRSALEASDYFLAIQNDPELALRYVEAGDEFTSLWYEKLRSDKLVKLRRRALGEFFGDLAAAKEVSNYRDEGSADFSKAVHPSYEAGIMSIIGKLIDTSNGAEWEFLGNWQHIRGVVFLLDCCALPVAIELMRAMSERTESKHVQSLSLPNIQGPSVGDWKKIAPALLKGVNLSISCAATHHQRYPGRQSMQSNDTPSG